LDIYRDNVHENGSWYGTFHLEIDYHPSNWGNWSNNQIERLFYKIGNGGTANGAAYNWNDPLGDIQDGSYSSGSRDLIVWLRGGATYHWNNMTPTSGWKLLNGNSGGTTITNTSGGTCIILSSQSSLVLGAKNNHTLPGYGANHGSLSIGGVPIIGSSGNAIDASGNLRLKNTKGVGAVTANPSLSTSSFADLPELGGGNSAMTLPLKGNPCFVGANLSFNAFTSGGSTGQVTGIGANFTNSVTSSTGPPSISVSISGNGTGAGAGVSWAQSGSYPNFVYTPTLSINGGSGYTSATATVTISNATGSGGYNNGTNNYSCSVNLSTLAAGKPIQVRILMDGVTAVGPYTITSDANGSAVLNALKLLFPTSGNHSFQVQGYNLTGAGVTVQSVNREFQLVELG
jgi:hypothetical protein